jgi:hypothetical protein
MLAYRPKARLSFIFFRQQDHPDAEMEKEFGLDDIALAVSFRLDKELFDSFLPKSFNSPRIERTSRPLRATNARTISRAVAAECRRSRNTTTRRPRRTSKSYHCWTSKATC